MFSFIYTFRNISLILLLGFSIFSLSTTHALAQPTQTINYQGKLTDSSGVAVADGAYNMRFFLYDAVGVATTSAVWTEVLTGGDQVQVTDGLFSIMLGSTTPLTSVDFNQPLYLGVEIGGSGAVSWDGEMSPRKPLGTVPSAFEAGRLGGVASSSFLRSDVDDTANGLLTFSGEIVSNATSTFNQYVTITDQLTIGSQATPGGLSGESVLSIAEDIVIPDSILVRGSEIIIDSSGSASNLSGQGLRGLYVENNYSGTFDQGTISGAYSRAYNYATSGSITHLIGSVGRSYNASSGTALGSYGVWATFDNTGTGTTTEGAAVIASSPVLSDGIVTDAYGVLAKPIATSGSGLVTNAYTGAFATLGDAENNNIAMLVGNEPTGPVNASLYVSNFVGGSWYPVIMRADSYDFDALDGDFSIDGFTTVQKNSTANSGDDNVLSVTGVQQDETTGTYRGAFVEATSNVTSAEGTIAGLTGAKIQSRHGNTGTVTNARTIEAIGRNTTTGAITNYYGFDTSITANNGTIDNTYGVYVGDVTTGTQTNNPYSFYASDANAYNYFAGNVGIGTTTPTETLTVDGRLYASSRSAFGTLDIGGFGSMLTVKPDGSDTQTGLLIVGADGDVGTNRLLNIDSVPGGNIMTVLSSGNVGIGTSSPAVKLAVDGNLALTGGIYDSNYTRGVSGQILQTTGAGTEWVATSSLGISTDDTVITVAANDTPATQKAVADYIADGTDDEVEIQAAIDSLPAGGGMVQLLSGTFNVGTTTYATSSIKINTAFTSLVGVGPSTVIRLQNNVTGTNNIIAVEANRVVMSGFLVDGNRDNNPTGPHRGVTYLNSDHPLLTEVTIREMNNSAVQAITTFGSFENNLIEDNAAGILFLGPNSTVNNNVIRNNDGLALSFFFGGFCLVNNNNIVNNLGSAMSLVSSNRCAFDGNLMQNNGGGINSSVSVNNSSNLVFGDNLIIATGTTPLIDIISGDNNGFFSNQYVNEDSSDYIDDGGTNTKYNEFNRNRIFTEDIEDYNVFSVAGSSTVGLVDISQEGTGDIMTLANATGTVFEIENNGSITNHLNHLERLSPFTPPGFALRLQAEGDYLYIADGNSGLRVVDISDPDNPANIDTIVDTDAAYDVAVSGQYIYVADDAGGMEIIDVSNPSNLTEVGQFDDGGGYVSIAVSGNYAYLPKTAGILEVVDISDPTNPFEVGQETLIGSSQDIKVIGKYAYIADGPAGLVTVDISDPTNPTLVDSISPGTGSAYALDISGKYAFVAEGSDGVAVFDISDPTNLSAAVETFDDGGTARDILVLGDYAYVADDDGGLEVLDVSDPTNIFEVAEYNTDGNARGVTVHNGYVYVGDRDDVEIFKINQVKLPSANIGSLIASQFNADSIYTNSLYIKNGLKVDKSVSISDRLFVGGEEVIAGDTVITVAANDTPTTTKANADFIADGTDDEVQIQAAIDSLPTTGGTIQLLSGTFNVGTTSRNTDSIFINKSGVTLMGEGGGTLLRAQADINLGDYFLINIDQDDVTIKDIEIDVNYGVSSPDAAGILVFTNRANVLIDNVEVYAGRNCVQSSAGSQLQVVNSTIHNCSNGFVGVAGSEVIFSNNFVYSNSGRGFLSFASIDESVISNNHFKNNGGGVNASLALDSGTNGVIIANNVIKATGTSPLISIGTGVNNTILSGNSYVNPDTTNYVNDLGTNTNYQEGDRQTVRTNFESDFNLLDVNGSTTATATAITQLGTGDILTLDNSSGRVLTILNDGNVGIGTSSPSSILSIDNRGFSGAGVWGIDQYLQTENSVDGAFQRGSQFFIEAANTATTTIAGALYRIKDDTDFGNTVRGLEVQTNRGVNTEGENTAISGFARTFGVRGVTTADAGGSFEPAGGYFETQGTTQGNAIRGYSDSITTATLLSLFQDTSSFEGTGLEMSFGNTTGDFASTSSKYLDFQNAGTSVFTVSAFGTTTIGDGTNQAGLQILNGGLCVDNGSGGGCSATTTGRITAVEYNTGNSDLAEVYFSAVDLEPGEIVTLAGGLSIDRAGTESTAPIIGVVSTKPGLTLGYDDTSLEEGEVAYPVALSGRVPIKLSTENGPIKKGDNLMLSSIPGVAMKAKGAGTIVGIALEDFDDSRMYSETFVNQFGDDMVDPTFDPILTNVDPRINDGCYFSGGAMVGDEPCVPLDSSSNEAQLEEANDIAERESVEEALNELRSEDSETVQLDNGTSVQVGQIVMFVKLKERLIDETQLASLGILVSTTSIDSLEEDGSVLDRLISLAESFVDGVLSIFELRVDRVEVAEELCVDGVCINSDDLRNMLNQNQPEPAESEPIPNDEESTEPDNSNTEVDEEYESVDPVVSTTSSSSTDEEVANDATEPELEVEETQSSTTEDVIEENPVEEETPTSSEEIESEEILSSNNSEESLEEAEVEVKEEGDFNEEETEEVVEGVEEESDESTQETEEAEVI